jgi:hypothetical protein
MNKSNFLELNLPSRDNTTDIADINAISDNFEIIDGAFLDLVEKEIPKLQTKENMNLNFDDDSTYEEQYPSVPAVVNFTNRKVNPLKIVNSASGNAIALKDSANYKLVNLKLYGKTTQDGTPTPDNPIPLVSVGDSGNYSVDLYGKNLFDINGNINTIGETKEQTNLNTVSGNILTCGADASKMGGVGQKINVSVGNTITFNAKLSSLGSGASGGLLIYENGNIVAYNFSSKLNEIIEVTYTTTTSELIFTFVTTGGTGAQFTNIQVELGSQTTPYEPFNKQSMTFTDTLRGIGDIKDEVDFNRGVLIQRFDIVDLGTLNWTYDSTTSRFIAGRMVAKPGTRTIKGMCNIYSVLSNGENFSADWNNVIYVGNKQIIVHNKRYTDATTFKSAMSGIMFIYEFETPIETPISETELNAYRQLHTNKPTTTILSEAEMLVDYVADPKNYIDNKIAELTALTLEG